MQLETEAEIEARARGVVIAVQRGRECDHLQVALSVAAISTVIIDGDDQRARAALAKYLRELADGLADADARETLTLN